jgi:putative redox protein
MAEAKITWQPGSRIYIGTDSTKHSVVISTTAEGVGMKPSELLLVAIGSCTAVDVVNILEKKRFQLNSLEITVIGEQDSDPPWTFRKIHLHFKIQGAELTDNAVEQAIQLSEEKYCSVSATVRATAEISTSYEIS